MDGLNKDDLIKLNALIKGVDDLSKKVCNDKTNTGRESKLIVDLQRAFNDLHSAHGNLEILLALGQFRK